MVSWGEHPDLKVEAGATEISSDSVTVILHRPENAISYCQLIANDYEGVNFIGNLDALTLVKVYFRYGSDSWTQELEGKVEKVGPVLTVNGQTVQAIPYGYGAALRDTHCSANYGAQISSSLDVPKEIWDDLIDNYVNKSFGGAATGYAITKTKIANLTNPTIPFLGGDYRSSLAVIDEVCRIYNAYRAGNAGVHWFVDPTKNLFINTIGAHENNATGWPTWWRTDQAGSTLVEGTDFVGYNFVKNLRGFANKVVVASDFRLPGYDYWTEGQAANWGNDGLTNITDDTTTYIVGSKSINFDMDAGSGRAYWPSGENAGWDLTKCGSQVTIPTINFYFYKDANCNEPACSLRLFTTDHDTDYYYNVFSTWGSDPNGEWIHRSLPIGPYWKTKDESRISRWTKGTGAIAAPGGNAVWTNINGVAFRITSDPATDTEFLIDDLHFAGKIIREAYNSTSIAANDERQKVLLLDTAIDDTLKASTDTGTAARLAYQELLLRQNMPVVGQVMTPGIVDILPGQMIHVHADQQSGGAYRIDSDFRVKEIISSFTENGFVTTLDVTDDVVNTFAIGYANMLETLAKAFHIDPEAQNLKASGIDIQVSRLSKDYP